jgi:hypothetical protein
LKHGVRGRAFFVTARYTIGGVEHPVHADRQHHQPTLWRFATGYTDAAHRRYTVAGQVQAPGTASGTVRITNRTGQCTTGTIAWTARH